MSIFNLFLRFVIAAAMMIPVVDAAAAYPDKPITIVVPFPAGSSADANVRVLAQQLKTILGVAVIVDNRAGATGTIGAQVVARAAPNGYTLLYHSAALAINPWLNKDAPAPLSSFVPIVQVASTPYIVAVRSALNIRTVPDLVAYASAHPGKLTCATYGIGSPAHLALEQFKRNAKISILHVPYRSFSQAFTDLNSGQVDCAIDLPANVMQHVKSGLLNAVAVTSASDLASVKNVPQLGYSVNVLGWSGLFAPIGTPADVVERIEVAVREALKADAVVNGLDAVGMSPSTNISPEQFSKTIKRDYDQFGEIIRVNDIKTE